MKTIASMFLGALLAGVLGAACTGCAQAQDRPPEPSVPPSRPSPGQKGKRPVPADTAPFKLAGPYSGIRQQRFVVVHDERALANLLKEHNPRGEFDTKGIDFKKNDVIAYFAGSKPTGGYSVDLLGIDRGKEGATVKLRLMKPGKGTMVTQAFTAPFLIQAVDKLPARVVHTVTEQEREAR